MDFNIDELQNIIKKDDFLVKFLNIIFDDYISKTNFSTRDEVLRYFLSLYCNEYGE